jgi:hypothetical protein
LEIVSSGGLSVVGILKLPVKYLVDPKLSIERVELSEMIFDFTPHPNSCEVEAEV